MVFVLTIIYNMNKRNLLLIILLSALLFVLSCDFFSTIFFPEKQSTAVLRGIVKNNRNGTEVPLPEILVTIDGKTDLTDPQGGFIINGVKTGNQTLEFKGSRYIDKSVKTIVKLSNNPETYYMEALNLNLSMENDTLNSLEDSASWDFNLNEPARLILDFGDSSKSEFDYNFPGTNVIISHLYKKSGNYTSSVNVKYSRYDFDTTASIPIHVKQNHKPIITKIVTDYQGFITNRDGKLQCTWIDSDSNPRGYYVDWGDGKIESLELMPVLTHKYSGSLPTTYTIRITIYDYSGSSFDTSFPANVKAIAEPSVIGPLLSTDIISSLDPPSQITARINVSKKYNGQCLNYIRWTYFRSNNGKKYSVDSMRYLPAEKGMISDQGFNDTIYISQPNLLFFESSSPFTENNYDSTTIEAVVADTNKLSTKVQAILHRKALE